jgi:aldehyde dehydrogenase (NAD+)
VWCVDIPRLGTTDDPSSSSSDICSRRRDTAEEVLSRDTYRHYIGGEWVSAANGETFRTVDPTSGEALAEAQAGTAPDIDQAVAAAREAFEGGWGDTHPD